MSGGNAFRGLAFPGGYTPSETLKSQIVDFSTKSVQSLYTKGVTDPIMNGIGGYQQQFFFNTSTLNYFNNVIDTPVKTWCEIPVLDNFFNGNWGWDSGLWY